MSTTLQDRFIRADILQGGKEEEEVGSHFPLLAREISGMRFYMLWGSQGIKFFICPPSPSFSNLQPCRESAIEMTRGNAYK